MIRCSNGYCCQDDEMCKGIDSCNKHRTGSLCGKCEANWTESLFFPECLLIEYCPAAEIIALYIICVVAYGLGLLALNYIKDVGPNMFKNMLIGIKRKIPSKKKKQHSPQNTHELENPKTILETAANESCISVTVPKTKVRCSKESFKQVEHKSQVDLSNNKSDKEEDDAMKYFQILLYYVQDAALIKLQLPSEGQKNESIVIKILQFSLELLVTFVHTCV